MFSPYHWRCLQVLKLNNGLAKINWTKYNGSNAEKDHQVISHFLKIINGFLTNRDLDY